MPSSTKALRPVGLMDGCLLGFSLLSPCCHVVSPYWALPMGRMVSCLVSPHWPRCSLLGLRDTLVSSVDSVFLTGSHGLMSPSRPRCSSLAHLLDTSLVSPRCRLGDLLVGDVGGTCWWEARGCGLGVVFGGDVLSPSRLPPLRGQLDVRGSWGEKACLPRVSPLLPRWLLGVSLLGLTQWDGLLDGY